MITRQQARQLYVFSSQSLADVIGLLQVLQTLSILIQNIRSQVAIFYLFSNNHVNDIVALRFDFDDDEVLGYYINLLKTISLKLNESTVQFFFQVGRSCSL